MSNNSSDNIDEENIEILDFNEQTNFDSDIKQSQIFDKNKEINNMIDSKDDNNLLSDVKSRIETKKSTNKLKIFIIALVTIMIIMVGIRYLFFNGEIDSNNSNSISGSIKYKMEEFNNNYYTFKLINNSSIINTINLIDKDTNKKIVYEFRINKGKVIVSNGNEEYTINKISKAKKLIVTSLGGILEYSGVFILTNDGEVYSISLFDNKYNMITDCKNFEQTIEKYNFKSKVKEITYGIYKSKDESSEENVILLKTVDSKQYILKK